ncbi:MAG TPA: GGDEF domain-containing protein [Coriobacteriia bacterium]
MVAMARTAAREGVAAASAVSSSAATLRDHSPAPRISDYIAISARVVLATLLIAMRATGMLEPRHGGDVYLLAALGLLVAAGAFGTLALVVWHQHPRRVLYELLVPDLICSALLIWVLAGYPDPLYPWMLCLAIMLGSGLAQRDAAVATGLVAVTYMSAYLFGQSVAAPGVVLLVLVKAVALLGTAMIVATVQRTQEERETHLRRSQREYHDLNDHLRRRLTELRAISEITELIHSTLDFEQVGQLVLEILSKVIDLPGSALFIIDKERDETVFNASFGIAPGLAKRTPTAYGPDAQIHGEEMFACTTLLDRAGLMVVFCASGERLERLGSEDRLVLTSVANELSVAVENSELYKLTRRLAVTDELTGLFNYRYLLERAEDEVGRARRFGRSLSLLMLDADEFKRYNDTHGHVAGDDALADLASVMRTAVRDIDVVCRYGGEEFAILLPETDAEGAFVVAEKVREAVAAHAFKNADGKRTERITVSIGLSTYPATATDRESLLRRADDALYVVKRSGRNRVSATPLGVDELRARDLEIERQAPRDAVAEGSA